jgi:hypothetical protein
MTIVEQNYRADIEFALHHRSSTRFCLYEFRPRNVIATILELSLEASNMPCSFHPNISNDLANIYTNLMTVAYLLNEDRTSIKFDPDAYQEILISLCHRLLHLYPLDGKRPASGEENAIHLGLLATMTTLLFHHGRG